MQNVFNVSRDMGLFARTEKVLALTDHRRDVALWCFAGLCPKLCPGPIHLYSFLSARMNVDSWHSTFNRDRAAALIYNNRMIKAQEELFIQ